MKEISRKQFLKSGTVAALGTSIMPFKDLTFKQSDAVNVGVIGTGDRGISLLRNLLNISDVKVVAVCDLYTSRAEKAANNCVEAGQEKPAIYCDDKYTYKEMLEAETLDAVIIATYWESHASIGIDALNQGLYPGIEVPMALTVEDLWKLVETSEATGVPCMMLENWSFRRDNLALLNMKRLGMFGDIVHCHCAHSHNTVPYWFFDRETGEQRWPAKYLVEYNRDQYPTHSVGPILSWMDINCGDVFTEIYSMANGSKGINFQLKNIFGEDHPNANLEYKQGDIVTSFLKTKKGKTLTIHYDMQLERPYSNMWMLQGLKGVYMEEKDAIYLSDKSPEYEQWEPWKPYEEEYNHKWWQHNIKTESHGGADFVMLTEFIKAVREKEPTPLDVYDSAVMSAIIELSGIAIKKNAPVKFTDFTKGEWKTRKPYFAIDKA